MEKLVKLGLTAKPKIDVCLGCPVLDLKDSTLIYLPLCSNWHLLGRLYGDIFVEQPWSTEYNLTHVHGDQVTPSLIFIMIETDWDKTLMFDLKRRESIHDTLNEWGGV